MNECFTFSSTAPWRQSGHQKSRWKSEPVSLLSNPPICCCGPWLQMQGMPSRWRMTARGRMNSEVCLCVAWKHRQPLILNPSIWLKPFALFYMCIFIHTCPTRLAQMFCLHLGRWHRNDGCRCQSMWKKSVGCCNEVNGWSIWSINIWTVHIEW